MRERRADLHIHTCLSPCAELEMVPTAIVRQAKAKGLDMIGICDHNSAENVGAVARIGQTASLSVIAGIEITSQEEVHVIGLFASEHAAQAVQRTVYEHLKGENDVDAFGYQVVVDETDEPLDINPRLLIGATDLSLAEVVQLIHQGGGLAIASHIDRQSFGIVGQLGFIPPGLMLDALEVSRSASIREWGDYSIITSSDAHRLSDIGACTTSFFTEDASFEEIAMALGRRDGRCVAIH